MGNQSCGVFNEKNLEAIVLVQEIFVFHLTW